MVPDLELAPALSWSACCPVTAASESLIINNNIIMSILVQNYAT